MRHDDVVIAMTSGNVDNMEKYQYMLGQIRTYQYLLQEISTLLKTKEQNENEGTVISIKSKDSNYQIKTLVGVKNQRKKK